MSNATLTKFGDPAALLCDYSHWRVLLRPAQVTLGALVLGAKSEETAFSRLPAGAFAELAQVTRDIETVLRGFVNFERINYVMLMMVDPHVHFHVLPRYRGDRMFAGEAFPDKGWPGPPEFSAAKNLDDGSRARLIETLRTRWPWSGQGGE